MAKQTVKQRKALRSEAAKRGWETRIARERREIELANAEIEAEFDRSIQALRRSQEPRAPSWDDVSGIPDILRGAPPKPSLWQRIKGWFA